MTDQPKTARDVVAQVEGELATAVKRIAKLEQALTDLLGLLDYPHTPTIEATLIHAARELLGAVPAPDLDAGCAQAAAE